MKQLIGSTKLRYAVRVIVFLLGLLLVLQAVTFAYDDLRSYTRLLMHDIYSNEDDYDLAFLGASHVYRGVDPQVLDAELSLNTFLLSSSSQMMSDSYYLLREAISSHRIKTLVFEVTYRAYASSAGHSRTATRILLNYFKPSMNAEEYCMEVLGHPRALEGAFRIVEDQKDMWAGLVDLVPLQKLRNEEYQDYFYSPETSDGYRGKGFVYTEGKVDRNVPLKYVEWGWDENDLDQDKLAMLERIIALCKQEGIELMFVSMPYHPAYLVRDPSYTQAHEYFARIAEREGIEFWDYNLAKQAHLPLVEEQFLNGTHINGRGAAVFSKVFASDYAAHLRGEDISTGFYKTLEAKSAEFSGLLGVALGLQVSESGSGIVGNAEGAYAGDLDVEYKFEVRKADEIVFKQDYSRAPTFAWETDKHGEYAVRVYARTVGSKQNYDVTQRDKIEF